MTNSVSGGVTMVVLIVPSNLSLTSGEYCDEFTLKQAVTFVIEDLDAGCLKSVIVRCGTEKYNFFDIQAMYQELVRLGSQG